MERLAPLSHCQITVPAGITYAQAQEARRGLPVIFHSNLVNFFSENDWSELERIAKQIRGLRPLLVVEHFSSFRPEEDQKTGVWFPEQSGSRPAIRERLSSTIKRWQDLTGAPISLENVPITERVDEYFDLLLETRDRTSCRITCDVPHFIISGLAARWNESVAAARAAALNPIQIHVAGLDLSEDRVYDGHNHPGSSVASYAKRLFPGAAHFTYEQPSGLGLAQTLARLDELRNASERSLPEDVRSRSTYSVQETNDRLTRETFSRFRSLKSVSKKRARERIHAGAEFGETALALLEKYQTFAWPLGSLDESAEKLTDAEVTEICAAFTNFALILQTWWSPGTPAFAQIDYRRNGSSIKTTLQLGPNGLKIVPDSPADLTDAFDVGTCAGASIIVKISTLKD